MITTTHTLIASDGSTVNAISDNAWRQSFEQQNKNAKFSRLDAAHNGGCKMCGRKMSRKAADSAWHIHMTTSGDLVPTSADMGSESQGWFPVGSECAKMIPLTHRTKAGA
jgi:hypothetical protein